MSANLDATKLSPGLTVNDLAKSLRFYEGLGFVIVDRFEFDGKLMGVMLKAGAATLGLSQDDFAKGRDRVKGVGMRIWAETTQDIDELAAKATAAGVALDAEPADMPWGARAFALTDPDGFKLTISRRS